MKALNKIKTGLVLIAAILLLFPGLGNAEVQHTDFSGKMGFNYEANIDVSNVLTPREIARTNITLPISLLPEPEYDGKEEIAEVVVVARRDDEPIPVIALIPIVAILVSTASLSIVWVPAISF